jgi:hypothetical protein
MTIDRGIPCPEIIDDDPDTVWGLWEAAVIEQDKAFLPTAPIPLNDFVENTTPIPLEESLHQRKAAAYEIIAQQYQRIADTIRIQWGYKECDEYISKLIMDASDSKGNSRIGFDQEIISALIVLSDIHTQTFGSFVSDTDFGHSIWTSL